MQTPATDDFCEAILLLVDVTNRRRSAAAFKAAGDVEYAIERQLVADSLSDYAMKLVMGSVEADSTHR